MTKQNWKELIGGSMNDPYNNSGQNTEVSELSSIGMFANGESVHLNVEISNSNNNDIWAFLSSGRD